MHPIPNIGINASGIPLIPIQGIGIVTQMESDDDWDDEARIEHVIYRA